MIDKENKILKSKIGEIFEKKLKNLIKYFYVYINNNIYLLYYT